MNKIMGWVKSLAKFVKDIVVESINQVFTILGFFVAWLTLTGTARDIVGYATLFSIGIWLLTIRLREED